MKNKILSIILLSMTIVSFGQITITNNNLAPAGTTIYLANDTTYTTGIVPGDPGVNKTWDFTNVTANTVDTLTLVLPASTPYNGEFPESNFALISSTNDSGDSGVIYSYMIRNEDKFSGIGFAGEIYGEDPFFSFIDPEDIILDFPVAYQNSYNESYTTEMTIGSPMPGADSIRIISMVEKETEIDAWGTISIPSGTYNALRQRVDEDQVDSTFVLMSGVWMFMFEDEISSTTYSWWTDDQSVGFVLFSIDVDPETSEVDYISFFNGSVVGLVETNNITAKVFPNPASDMINIEFDGSISGELTIMNQLGQVFIREDLNEQKSIKLIVSGLTSGMYIYNVTNGTGGIVSNGKFQKH